MWLCLSGIFSCLKLDRYAAYPSREVHPPAEATVSIVQVKNTPLVSFSPTLSGQTGNMMKTTQRLNHRAIPAILRLANIDIAKVQIMLIH